MFLTDTSSGEKEKGRKQFPEHTVCVWVSPNAGEDVETRGHLDIGDGSHSAKVWQFLSKPKGALTHHMAQELQSWVFVSNDFIFIQKLVHKHSSQLHS